MSEPKPVRRAVGQGAFAAAACTACCAPPILAALGLTAGLAVVGLVFLGIAAAVAVVSIGLTAVLVRPWRRARVPGDTACAPTAPTAEPVPVDGPVRRRAS